MAQTTAASHNSSTVQSLLICRSRHREDEVALQQGLLGSGQTVWHLPGDLTWDNVSRVLLR